MTAVAGLVPKVTAVVPDRFVPVMVTGVPPPVDPWFGEMGMGRLLADGTGQTQRTQRDRETAGPTFKEGPREDERLNRAAGVTEFPRRHTKEEPADTALCRDPR
ncbi:hypothetical protein GCM10011583_42270 [Streptomyces camponoticapitis]|uniref:Uncharacterized protein n=1 Tax=Streptomyces camponoticapitis TaxID=1616125 RepID=A0ABQ2EGM9_9ACTN|nr:hypothetical protein GCM10011583_42270 [Streptomyces camponoticapitis]